MNGVKLLQQRDHLVPDSQESVNLLLEVELQTIQDKDVLEYLLCLLLIGLQQAQKFQQILVILVAEGSQLVIRDEFWVLFFSHYVNVRSGIGVDWLICEVQSE